MKRRNEDGNGEAKAKANEWIIAASRTTKCVINSFDNVGALFLFIEF
jgi:hypothetical protein